VSLSDTESVCMVAPSDHHRSGFHRRRTASKSSPSSIATNTVCYLPMVCFLTFNEEAEQYLVAAVLRRGNAPGSAGAVGILRRLIARVSDAFLKVKIRVRLGGGFASPRVLDFLDCEPKMKYFNTPTHAMTATAYVLMQEMRLSDTRKVLFATKFEQLVRPTRHARAQVLTSREHFLKLGAHAMVSVRRIVLHLTQAFPYRNSFHRLALSLGAQTG
jgi:hypothetical protein